MNGVDQQIRGQALKLFFITVDIQGWLKLKFCG
jgi:hypothetical protein